MSKTGIEQANKYVDLKINGRLFPTWVMANFKKYKLEEVFKKTSDDPCNEKTDTGELKLELRKYQIFVSQYLDYKSPHRNILMYMGTGVGKTATALNIYNVLYNYTSGWNVFILIKASLKGEWLDNIKTWLRKDEYEYRYRNIVFINYDSPIADRKFMDAIKNVDSSKKSLYIIEEVHNFIRNVYGNISTGNGKRAQSIYDYIIQDKKENPDTRVVLLSATPAVNNPFELALLFNLLRPGAFPKSENEFNQHYISNTTYQTLNPNSKNMFQRRIVGLVSYYFGATADLYASKSVHYVDVPMSDYQEDIYGYYEEIEAKLALKSNSGKGGSQVYKSYTRQACNFVFPAISQKINGEGRPRPGKFRISERDALKLSETGEIKTDTDKSKLVYVKEYLNAIKSYMDGFTSHLDDKQDEDQKNGYTIQDDIKTFLTKYNGDYEKFHQDEKKKSNLYEAIHVSTAKMLYIIFNIMKSEGPVLVYSNYVLMEGLEIFKLLLKYFNFYNYMTKMELVKDKIGYVEFHGGIKNIEDRFKGKDAFNMPENKLGELIKIILVSPAGTEGLSLKNVRQIHIMEPYWNEVRITQMMGRGIRQCSHKALPMDKRHVDVYRYKMTRKNKDKWSTDQHIEDLARSKDGLIQSFLDAMKEVAVDCKLFESHNLLTQEYKCFNFDEPSLFEPYPGPAYKEDLADDIKMDNGSNSTKSISLKIKAMKVKAVMLLSKPGEEPEYSKPSNYLLYSQSGVIYDFDLHYAVGKIAIDENNIPIKLDKDTYIIDYVIPIPMITE